MNGAMQRRGRVGRRAKPRMGGGRREEIRRGKGEGKGKHSDRAGETVDGGEEKGSTQGMRRGGGEGRTGEERSNGRGGGA